MQIQRDDTAGRYIIKSYQPGTVVINNTEHHSSVIVSRDKLITDWAPCSIDDLSAEHLGQILELNPEVILLGTGATLVFPDQKLLAPIYQQQLGVEVMDSHAACRTFNLLMSDGRNVLAAIIV